MSWYVNIRVGKKNPETGLIEPYVMYGDEWAIIHSTSRSFTTDLKEEFTPIKASALSDAAVEKLFGWECDPDGEETIDDKRKTIDGDGQWGMSSFLGVLTIQELRALDVGNGFYDGFIPVEDAKELAKENYTIGDRYDYISEVIEPSVFAQMVVADPTVAKQYVHCVWHEYVSMGYEKSFLLDIASEAPYADIDNIVFVKTEG